MWEAALWQTTAATAAGVGAAAWAVRGKASPVFGPNVWRGPGDRKAIALTFDDGPSEGTAELLALLAQYNAKATFFQCGANAERSPLTAREVAGAGHEIGNHTHSHPKLYLKSPAFVREEIGRGQAALESIHGAAPRCFRAPYGVRWFGMRGAMAQHGLTHVAWTTIAGDWHLPAKEIVARCRRDIRPGAIWCFHDGRELSTNPDIRDTLDSIRQLLPMLRDEGYELVTLSELLRKT